MAAFLTLHEILWNTKMPDLQKVLEEELQKASCSVQDLQIFRDKEERILNQWATLLDFFWQSLTETKKQLLLHGPETRTFMDLDIYYSRLQMSINFYSSAIEVKKAALKKCDALLVSVPVLRIVYEKRFQSKNVVENNVALFVEYLEERKIQLLKTGDRIVSEWIYLYPLRSTRIQ